MDLLSLLSDALNSGSVTAVIVALALIVGWRVERRIDQLFVMIETLIQVIITDQD
jgi:hypothetical protein